MTTTAFTRWLDTLVDEKGLNTEHVFEKTSPNGTLNVIPLGSVLTKIKEAPTSEQAEIKKLLVMIDFRNGDVMHLFAHLAGALALSI
jgi:hypothetical protein